MKARFARDPADELVDEGVIVWGRGLRPEELPPPKTYPPSERDDRSRRAMTRQDILDQMGLPHQLVEPIELVVWDTDPIAE